MICKYAKQKIVCTTPYSSMAPITDTEARRIVFRTYKEWPRCNVSDTELKLQSQFDWNKKSLEWYFECDDCGIIAMGHVGEFTHPVFVEFSK